MGKELSQLSPKGVANNVLVYRAFDIGTLNLGRRLQKAVILKLPEYLVDSQVICTYRLARENAIKAGSLISLAEEGSDSCCKLLFSLTASGSGASASHGHFVV